MTGCYLLHFAERISPDHLCQHYIGWAENIDRRIAEHRAGGIHAARLCQVAKERGIPFTVAQVWPEGDRQLERRLKNRHGSRLCPICHERHEQPHQIDVDLASVAELAF